MSLYGAMFSAVSGLNSQSQALGMISDNITNVNTVGYKTTNASFSTLVTRSSPNFHSPGGVRSQPLSINDQQGLLQSSASATDLAISGQGFFVVTDTNTPTATDTRFYTRAGQFVTDDDGYLVSPAGYNLQGWRTDVNGVPVAANTSVLTSLESVRVSTVASSANPSTALDVGVNLPAAAVATDTHITNAVVFDALGADHNLQFTWTKQAAPLTWTLQITTPDAAAVEEAAGVPYNVTVVFNNDGTPASFDGGTTPPNISILGWTNGAANSNLTLDLGTAGAVGTALADGITQFDGPFSTGFVNQNGNRLGNFVGVQVDDQGIVTALFDNGETLPIYQLPIATFPNPNGLDAQSGTVFTQSERSGDFILRRPGEANAGTVASGALEASTTDLAEEFTNMIITQRAYSASTRSITTANDMLAELIQIAN